MAFNDKKISQLDYISTPGAGDEIAVVNLGVTKRTTIGKLLQTVNTGTGSFVENATIANNIITFTRADGTTFTATIASSSMAERVDKKLTNGTGVDALDYDGSVAATASIGTYSASAATDLTNISSSTATAITNLSSSAASSRNSLSSSFATDLNQVSSSLTGSTETLSASFADALTAYSASDAAALTGSISDLSSSASTAREALSASNSTARESISASSAQALDNYSQSAATQWTFLSSSADVARNALATDGTNTPQSLNQGLGIIPFSFNGSIARNVILDTASAHYLVPIGNYTQSLSASNSTARDTAALQVSGAFDSVSASFSTSETNLSSSTALALTNFSQSNAASLRPSSSYAITSSHAQDLPNGSVNTVELADDAVTYAKIGDQFTTKDTLTGTTPAIDFSAAAIFEQTLTANTTYTITNQQMADVKTLIIDCAGFTPTLPGTVTIVGGGTFDTTSGTTNVISILCDDDTAPTFKATILTS